MSEPQELKQIVKDKYGQLARERRNCCSGSCDPIGGESFAEGYDNLAGYMPEADLGLGCGLPTLDTIIGPGDTVLDLGSGAGNDAFVARAQVGDEGKVIGVDMTPDMVARADANAARLGLANVEFRLGEIEDLPVDDASVDVVISNCVLNLVPDKKRAFAEIHRVLRPEGRFSVSDIVLRGELPEQLRGAAVLYVGCVAGAQRREEYLASIAASGFRDIQVRRSRPIELPDELLAEALDADQRAAFADSGLRIESITVTGRR